MPGVDGSDPDDDADQDVDQAGARDVVVHGFADTADDDPPRQVGHGGQADKGGQQQRRRRQDDGSPDAARLARYGRKQRRTESQRQTHDGEQESHPDLRQSQAWEARRG